MTGESSRRIFPSIVVILLILNSCAGQLHLTIASSATPEETPSETELKPTGTMEYISGTVVVPGIGAYSLFLLRLL